MSVAVLDGVGSSAEEARLPIHDRGLLFGDGVFETLRARPSPVRLEAHLARLEAACGVIGLAGPPMAALRADLTLALDLLAAPEARVRVTVTRGSNDWCSNDRCSNDRPAAPDPHLATQPRRLVLAAPAAPLRPVEERGRTAALAPLGPIIPPMGVKSTSWGAAVYALGVARARGADELITTTPDGLVLEAATASVFAVIAGALVTPPLHGGLGALPLVLPGIARARLLGGLSCEERPLPREALLDATEVFLASSYREVVPIVSLDGRLVGAGRVGPAARAAAGLLGAD